LAVITAQLGLIVLAQSPTSQPFMQPPLAQQRSSLHIRTLKSASGAGRVEKILMC
jgi:hypothetical protein